MLTSVCWDDENVTFQELTMWLSQILIPRNKQRSSSSSPWTVVMLLGGELTTAMLFLQEIGAKIT